MNVTNRSEREEQGDPASARPHLTHAQPQAHARALTSVKEGSAVIRGVETVVAGGATPSRYHKTRGALISGAVGLADTQQLIPGRRVRPLAQARAAPSTPPPSPCRPALTTL